MFRRTIISSIESYHLRLPAMRSTPMSPYDIKYIINYHGSYLILLGVMVFGLGFAIDLAAISLVMKEEQLNSDFAPFILFGLPFFQFFLIKRLISNKEGIFFYALNSILSPNPIVLSSILHNILPSKNQRILEVYEFLLANNIIRPEQSPIDYERENPLSTKSIIRSLEEEIKNLPSFVETYFSKSQSLTRFIGENIKDDEGKLNTYLLLFMLAIPKRKKLSIDAIKEIIKSALQHYGDPNLFEGYGLSKFLKEPELVEREFSEYSEIQIKKLLTSKYSPTEFCDLLKLVLIEKKDTNPDYKFISQVISNVKRNSAAPKLIKLNGTHEDLTFKVLETKYDYEKARNDFKNCVRTYFSNPSLDILVVHQGTKPLACVAVDQFLKIKEIKAPFNENVRGDIRQLINQKLVNL